MHPPVSPPPSAATAFELPPGTVALVGAGPGDPGLLTLHALRALQAAEVLLYDRLVGPEVLALAAPTALRVEVGKAAGQHSVAQEQIHALMLLHARAGRRVVRLKGGDPFVFGRGGEELRVLRAAGIPYEVIPGSTAAVGAAAYAGIPLTDRGQAAGARLLTARRAPDPGTAAPDLAAHGAGDDTLAIYMGRGQLRDSARALLRGGRAGATAVALVEHATRPAQRVLTTTLDVLADDRLELDLQGPVIQLVGESAALAADLHWYGRAPEPLVAPQGIAGLQGGALERAS